VASYAAGLPDIDILAAVKLAGQTFSQKDQSDFAMTSILQQYMQLGNTDGLADAYAWYLAQRPGKEYLDQVSDLYGTTMALVAGSRAPEIEMEDIDGNRLLLSDLFGKVLYIDFWATWCGPCRAEIPHLSRLAQKYARNADVCFVSISLDEDRNAWETDVKQADHPWPQYILTESGQKQVAEVYKITGIPRFVIIDANGLLYDVNAQRPSSPSVAAQIDAAVTGLTPLS